MPDPAPVAVLAGATVRYGTTTALDHIDLRVERGEILGVIGESGAGKSTMLGLLDAVTDPTAGHVLIDGTDPRTLTEKHRRLLRRRIGMVFQGFHLLANRTVRQNVALPLKLQRRRDDALVDQLLDYVGLTGLADRHPSRLSGGQQQRVAIARALITRPQLLLCDEPTSALDARTSTGILDLLSATRDDFGTSIVLVTHELSAVRAVCDRAAVLEYGVLQDVITIPAADRDAEERSYLAHAQRVLTA